MRGVSEKEPERQPESEHEACLSPLRREGAAHERERRDMDQVERVAQLAQEPRGGTVEQRRERAVRTNRHGADERAERRAERQVRRRREREQCEGQSERERRSEA